MKRLLPLCLLAMTCAGCFRTTYSHLGPVSTNPVNEPTHTRRDAPPSWQHFFLFGWVPTEKTIDAAGACGGAQHVKQIETRETFVQGLVTALSTFYINVYSPYTGAVTCDDTREP
jgi:hypothetical protein